MCLFNPKKIKQTKDIVCYKIFYKYTDTSWYSKIKNKLFYSKTLFSLYRNTKYKLGKLSKLNVLEPSHDSYGNIEGNAIHSFTTYDDALNFLKCDYHFIHQTKISTPCIVQCRIPKNNNFLYKGTFFCDWDDYSSYVSEKLIPEEILVEWTNKEN